MFLTCSPRRQFNRHRSHCFCIAALVVKFPVFHPPAFQEHICFIILFSLCCCKFYHKKYFWRAKNQFPDGRMLSVASRHLHPQTVQSQWETEVNRKQHNWSLYKKRGPAEAVVGLWGTRVLLADWKVFDYKATFAAWSCFSVPVVTVVKYDPDLFSSVPARISKWVEAVSGVCSFLSQSVISFLLLSN